MDYNNEAMKSTLRVTKALADIQRIRILMMLEPGELCVCQIVEVLKLAPSTVSKHLSILADAGLLLCRKDGRWCHYKLPNKKSGAFVLPVLRWLRAALDEEETMMIDKKKLASVVDTDIDSLCRIQRLKNNKVKIN